MGTLSNNNLSTINARDPTIKLNINKSKDNMQ